MAGKRLLRVAVEGCCHGELDKIYDTMKHLETQSGKAIDLLICCGDFQTVRNLDDLECLACPPKYRALNTFWKYYTGRATAPFPTLFIGGNHEAMNYLWELYYGGWVAPNIYYLGHAGVVKFGGIRIGGISGIFNGGHYKQGHWEKPPYDNSSMRSAYHIRELDVYRLLQVHRPLDVFLSHDWPRGIAHHGNKAQLLRAKPFLRQEIEDGSLGSPPGEQILHELQPAHWFSAHLHVKYAALVSHSKQQQHKQTQQDRRQGRQGRGQKRKSPSRGASPPPRVGQGPKSGEKFTKFLALDKCLPRRGFLQVVEFPDVDGPLEFGYDEEWLGVLQATHHLMSLNRQQAPLPGMGGSRSAVSNAQLQQLKEKLQQQNNGAVPLNFVHTSPGHDPAASNPKGHMPRQSPRNPQTEQFLEMLGLPYNLDQQFRHSVLPKPDPNELPLDETAAANPEEIELDDVVGDDDGDDDNKAAEAAVEAAQTAKQALGDDNSMFQSDTLHNFDPNAAVPKGQGEDGPSVSEASALQSRSQHATGLSAALAAIVPAASSRQSDSDSAAQ